MARKLSFKKGTGARKARGKLAEKLKREGKSDSSAFAIATAATKRMSPKGRKRAARKRKL